MKLTDDMTMTQCYDTVQGYDSGFFDCLKQVKISLISKSLEFAKSYKEGWKDALAIL